MTESYYKDPESIRNRNYIIRELRARGDTLDSIGKRFDISRERVRQISRGITPAKRLTMLELKARIKKISPEVRFWNYVKIGEQDECWEWTGSKMTIGYGRYHRTYAHKYSFALAYGEMPEGKTWVCHTCDNPSCVNPLHLYPGDAKDNARDRQTRGRGGQLKRMDTELVSKIKADLQTLNQTEVCKKYGIPYANIHNIKMGRTYKAVVWYPDTGEERSVVITEGKVLKVEEP